jgi:hypothetical protein
VERLSSVYVYGSGRFLVTPIQREHKFDFLGLLAKFIIGALSEASTHCVIVDAQVEYLGEIGQKAVAIAAASTDKQHFWFRAFEFADSSLLVPQAEPTSEPGVRIGMVGPGTVGTNSLVATSDQLLVDRGFTGTRQALH